MTLFRFVVVLFIMVSSVVSSFADDEAFDFFVEACRHSGYNPAEISTFQAELTVVSQMTMPESVIEQITKDTIADLEATLRQVEKDEQIIQEQLQRDKEDIVVKHRQSLSGEAQSRLIKVLIKNSAAPLGLEDTPPQVLEIDLSVNVSSNDVRPSALFHSSQGIVPSDGVPKRQANISQSGHATTIEKGLKDAWYYTGGRLQSTITVTALNMLMTRGDDGQFTISEAGITAFRKKCEDHKFAFTLSKENVKYEGDHEAHILEFYVEGVLRERLWIDPDRGYICPQEEGFYNQNGRIAYKVVSEKFTLDEHSQKWFPSKVVHSSWTDTDQPGEQMSMVSEYRLMPGTLILNQPIPDSTFRITVPQGMRVDDRRRGDNNKVTFIANQTSTLDLPTVEKQSLDDMPWLTPQGVRQPYEPPPAETPTLRWVRIVSTAAGIIMILLWFILYFYKRARKGI